MVYIPKAVRELAKIIMGEQAEFTIVNEHCESRKLLTPILELRKVYHKLYRGLPQKIRKYTKTKSAFTSENASIKLAYRAITRISKKRANQC